MDENNTKTGFIKKLFGKKSTKIAAFAALLVIAFLILLIFQQNYRATPNELSEPIDAIADNSNANDISVNGEDINKIDAIDKEEDIEKIIDEAEDIAELEVAASAVGEINIVPLKSSEKGVELSSQFMINTKYDTTVADLTSRLAVKSGESYDLQEAENDGGNNVGHKAYVMTFSEPLKYDSIYKIEYTEEGKKPLSFAFQTVESFKVVSTNPAKDAYNVPVASGIEVTFSEEITGNFEDYFIIKPQINGKFDKVGNTYIFIPDSLKYDAEYRITIKSGVTGLTSGKVLEEDYNFNFRTKWGKEASTLAISGERYETFLTDDEVFVEINASSEFQSKTYSVEIYDLKNPANYLNTAQSTLNYELPADAVHIESLKTELYVVKGDENDYYTYCYIMLNKKYPNGWYLIQISTEHDGKTHTMYKAIQVSPLSVYSASFQGETIFWVNDTNTKFPAAGAEIAIDGKSIKTDSEGMAIIETGSVTASNIKINFSNYPAFVYTVQTYADNPLSIDKRYYAYLYTDRSAYRPTDTIDVFGVLRQRYSEYPITSSDKITLKFGNMLEIPVTLDKYGSFNVKIPVENMSSNNGVSLGLRYNDTALNAYAYAKFIDYDNAKYIITAETDKFVYRPNERAEVEVSVTTYDNAPVAGLEIIKDDSTAAMTDSEGKVSIIETATRGYSTGWQPNEQSFYYNAGKTENDIQYISCPYVVMPSDIMLECKKISDGTIEFTANMIDREVIEKSIAESWFNVYWLSPELYKSTPADVEFSLEVHKYSIIREKTGEKYDYIEKVNVPVYTYRNEDVVYNTYTAKTTNGKVVLSNLPESDDVYSYYYAYAKYKDTEGNDISIYVRISDTSMSRVNQSSIIDYYFAIQQPDGYFNPYSAKLKVGETGLVKLRDRAYDANYMNGYTYVYNNTHDITEGKILTILMHNKILDTQIGSPDGTPVTFTEDCIYNSEVFGAYFDGKHIYPIKYGVTINYNYDQRKLNFNTSFDKEEYTPGSEVTATVKVTDENGKPKKTLVNISVVDEAAFAEESHDARFIEQYYSSIRIDSARYNYFASYTQHEFLNAAMGAEMGGGGGATPMRKDFRDNPAFETVETDENGVAEIKFKLADAITSWRVTVHGITEDNFAGTEKKNIIASLPFNIDIVMLNEFVVGDDVFMTVKPFGRQYKYNETEIKYTCEILQGNKVIASKTESSVKYFNFNAGKLPEGDYIIRVTAETANNFTDGMEKEFKVVKTGVALSLVSDEVISKDSPSLRGYDIKTSPVTVTFSNYDISFITKTLYSCMNSASKRTDYIAANVFAKRYLESLYNKTPLKIANSDYQNIYFGEYAGKGELTYGEPDVLYTARFTACFPETVNTTSEYYINNLKEFLQVKCNMYVKDDKGLNAVSPEFTGNENAELLRAAGYFTLAAVGEKVLLEIQEQVEIILNSEDQSKFTDSYESQMRVLFYAAALCAIGDDTGAYQLIDRYKIPDKIYPSAADENTKIMKKEYIDTIMLYINTVIDPVEAYNYIKTKLPNKYISDVCEKINFIRHFALAKGTVSEIEYTLDGEVKREVFSNFDVLRLVISKEQFENLAIKHISGNTAVNVEFTGSPENLDELGNKINIEKLILTKKEFCDLTGRDIDTEADADDSVVYVAFKVKIPESSRREYYTIRDRLPSNMRYLKSDINANGNIRNARGETYNADGSENYYVQNIEKQTVEIYFSSDGSEEIIVAYNAIKINDSSAISEKAYVSAGFNLNGIWGASK